MRTSGAIGRKGAILAASVAMLAVGGCTAIRENRGYIADNLLYNGIQAGVDNQRSVEATLGRPTFTSQFGTPTWYYVSSVTGQRPFARPKIADQSVMAVTFDAAGNVATVDRNNTLDRVVFLTPESDETPTLGRERGFLEDLFGNIGAVGAGGAGANPNG